VIYIEFRIRRPGIDLEIFHQLTGRRTEGWSDRFSEDRLILNLGRTWRIGPRPEYLAIYYTPGGTLERFSQWEAIFRSGAVADLEAQTRAASTIEDAGCYTELREPVLGGHGGPYYAEYLDFRSGVQTSAITRFFEDRQARHGDLTLHLLCDRIGKLGPEPRGLAIWGGESYASFSEVAAEAANQHDSPVEVLRAGFYADVGSEIL
jgi:hypothetical protein